jgi:hypothetical protein
MRSTTGFLSIKLSSQATIKRVAQPALKSLESSALPIIVQLFAGTYTPFQYSPLAVPAAIITFAPENINRTKYLGMKKVVMLLIVVLTTVGLFAQTKTDADKSALLDNAVVYRLFPTENMWTFIKLNTRTGQMWQVQYSINDDGGRFETYLNIEPLVPKEEEVNGRFTLYPTQNMWTFILLDQLDGQTWQVQWSTKADNRGIIPII